jgi:hypothetical protein
VETHALMRQLPNLPTLTIDRFQLDDFDDGQSDDCCDFHPVSVTAEGR